MNDATKSLRYLIGGNPGGATHFTARYLTKCGFPTTHESFDWVGGKMIRVFNQVTDVTNPVAECSYTVNEWFHRPGVEGLPVILIYRNPFDILNSQIAKKIQDGSPVDPDVMMSSIIERLESYEDSKRVVFRFRVEFDLESLCEFLQIKPVETHSIDRHTHANGRSFLSRSDVEGYDMSKAFKRLCDTLDYLVWS
jgi:hypothetical protein